MLQQFSFFFFFPPLSSAVLAISLGGCFVRVACLLSPDVLLCSWREISGCKSVRLHQVDFVSCAEARHSQTAAIRKIAHGHMLHYGPSVPLRISACLQGLLTPFGVSWNAYTTPRLAAPHLSRMFSTLKIWPGATSDVWKWIIKRVTSPQRVSVDTCLSGIRIFLTGCDSGICITPLQGLFSAGTSGSEVFSLIYFLSASLFHCISLLSASLLCFLRFSCVLCYRLQ